LQLHLHFDRIYSVVGSLHFTTVQTLAKYHFIAHLIAHTQNRQKHYLR